ncbi:MAG: lipopolysaccharide heptosyltransferase II [Candidatus Omnitrophica bacterium]|nr:lipopolysaccharide heptosyltransferase II [Candidatus Omnitrophota bacterium]
MKILIVTKNWIGDVLFQLPAIQAVRNHYPDAEITCLTPERCLEVLRAHPAVDHLISFDERTTHRSLASKARLIAALRKTKWDKAYLFHRSNSRALLLALGGVRQRVGFGSPRRFFLTRAYPELKNSGHHADSMLELLRLDGIPVPERGVYQFYYSAQAKARAIQLLVRRGLKENAFVVFHLGANWAPKRWPPEHFSALADWIHDKLGLAVAVTGAAGDRPLWEAFRKNVSRAHVTSFMGETTLEETGALFRRACFLVTGDSGPMHIAAGVGIPVLALFGPTHPDISGPRGIGAVEILSFVPEGYKAPWYTDEMPAGGWLSQIHPETVQQRLLEKGWGRTSLTAGPEPVSSRHILTEEESRVRRILWVTLSNLGDVIMTTPVLRTLAGRFPNAEITAVVSPRASGILKNSRMIKRLVIYDKKIGLIRQRPFLKELRRERYDLVVDLRNTAIPWLVCSKRRSPLWRPLKSRSMRARHLEVLSLMGLRSEAVPEFDFFQTEDEKKVLEKLKARGVPFGEGLILFAPVAASGLKTWPIEKFEQTLKALLERTRFSVLIVGDDRERERAGKLEALNPARVFNFAGQTSFPETAALTARARLVVANDSAIMHLAFELGVPAAAVFGPTSHEKYGHKRENFQVVRAGSACSPCEQPRCRFNRQHCFEDLQPQALLNACEVLLQ